MTTPKEKEREELGPQVRARHFLILWLLPNKTVRQPQSFTPAEVNSNLHSSQVNDVSWKIKVKTPGQTDPTNFPKSRQPVTSKYV